ncbi:Holliday junction branch migration protein RuvA [Alicyclobacillus acidiphilus]|uniref:Holliday junction branch migration protein RuvA n=1 Tax=Alicyclobacillus acidiphilus TaxID=182455 RepID=UPI00082E81CF|nr:Holliday junction branch migration protein RuvA [Alicyclobacillus acidiphilus]
MIVFLRGRLAARGPGYIDLDVHGVGYRVYVTDETSAAIAHDGESTVYTYQHVREDGVFLYGFLRPEERAVFEKLLLVSGVGPRLALGILGAISAEAVVTAIQTEDANLLCTLPGVGKKTAQRMILDLKDKLGDLPLDWNGIVRGASAHPQGPADMQDDVITALVALGYRMREAEQAVSAVFSENSDLTVEAAVKAALAWLYVHQQDA